MKFALLHYTPVSFEFIAFSICNIFRILICLDLYMPNENIFRIILSLGNLYFSKEWSIKKLLKE